MSTNMKSTYNSGYKDNYMFQERFNNDVYEENNRGKGEKEQSESVRSNGGVGTAIGLGILVISKAMGMLFQHTEHRVKSAPVLESIGLCIK